MRTLFLRIFLAFWAATVLVVLATAGLTWYRFNMIWSIPIDRPAFAAQAEARLQEQGLAGLRQWIVETEPHYPARVFYVIDATGRELLDRQMPINFVSYIERLKAVGALRQNPQPSDDTEPVILTPIFYDRDGNMFTLMITNPEWSVMLESTDVQLMVLLFALCVSGFVCWWLARYVSLPVVRLQYSARSLAEGNLEARVGQEFSLRRDELGVLARDFDTMAQHIRSLIDSKELLIGGMSHELRSPLARLHVALGLARRDPQDLPRQLDRIELEAERLDSLIGQMLQISRLRSIPQQSPMMEYVELDELIGEIVQDAQLEAGAMDRHVTWIASATPSIRGDRNLLRSAIENVVRNAIRFTSRYIAVHIRLAVQDNHAVITVEDCGPGIPEQELKRVFEPFYRVTASRDRDSGGTGLGLAISARAVNLHGGSIHAVNKPEGGLLVTITLPLTQPDVHTSHLPVERGLPGSREVTVDEPSALHLPQPPDRKGVCFR